MGVSQNPRGVAGVPIIIVHPHFTEAYAAADALPYSLAFIFLLEMHAKKEPIKHTQGNARHLISIRSRQISICSLPCSTAFIFLLEKHAKKESIKHTQGNARHLLSSRSRQISICSLPCSTAFIFLLERHVKTYICEWTLITVPRC